MVDTFMIYKAARVKSNLPVTLILRSCDSKVAPFFDGGVHICRAAIGILKQGNDLFIWHEPSLYTLHEAIPMEDECDTPILVETK